MRFHVLARRIFVIPALGLALGAMAAACSSSSSSPATSPASSSAPASSAPASAPATPASTSGSGAVAQITANWEKFFSASTPISAKASLLQNGSAFTSAMSQFDKLAPKGLGAKVTGVTVTSPTSATVKYDITAGSATLLPNQTGQAVLQGGTWKVGDTSFCSLLKLAPGETLPAACNGA
jgi:hypothetical protein